MLLPAEREELMRKVRGAFAGAVDFLGPLERLGIDRRTLEEHLAVAADRRQDVVEIMGDAAGELTNGLYFLSMAIAFLELSPIADILDGAMDAYDSPRGVMERAGAFPNVHRCAVATRPGGVAADDTVCRR